MWFLSNDFTMSWLKAFLALISVVVSASPMMHFTKNPFLFSFCKLCIAIWGSILFALPLQFLWQLCFNFLPILFPNEQYLHLFVQTCQLRIFFVFIPIVERWPDKLSWKFIKYIISLCMSVCMCIISIKMLILTEVHSPVILLCYKIFLQLPLQFY